MIYTELSRSKKISRLSLGAMNFGSRIDKETSFALLDKAYELGISFIDTANAYGKSEQILGEWFGKTGNRDAFLISTKVGWPMGDGPQNKGLSQNHIQDQIQQSLGKLQTDYIDIYQPHYLDDSVTIEQIATTFSDLREDGIINLIGAPVFSKAYQTMHWYYRAKELGLHNIGFKQFPFSMLSRGFSKGDHADICKTLDIPVAVFGTMGGGLLTGKYVSSKPFPENGKEMLRKIHAGGKVDDIMEKLELISKDKGYSTTQIALAWVLNHDFHQSAIIGASSPDQLEDITKAMEISFSEEEFAELTQLSDANYIW